ncbi:hypothetical protein M885DRAFT_524680 [Pelagophyceae sp. CCMP2097]|nr:hypothetical protein M885DRAFT_524680 [Pelagophyceae sp. CCMP2097]
MRLLRPLLFSLSASRFHVADGLARQGLVSRSQSGRLMTMRTATMNGRASGPAKPTKLCVTCNRPFEWRKKWERCWDEVTTCSKRCNSERRGANKNANDDDDDDEDDAPRKTSKAERRSAAKGAANDDDDDAPRNSGKDGAGLKADRKADRKAGKAEKRDKREGTSAEAVGQKPCGQCDKLSDLLIRCTIDESQAWHMVCGKCWKDVSGGVTDGDAAHPFYRYGGLWKNRHAAPQSTKPPKRASENTSADDDMRTLVLDDV